MSVIKRTLLILSLLLIGGTFTVALAEHKEGFKEGSQIPAKMAQGILKATDPLNHTITMDMGAVEEDREIRDHQFTTLKMSNEAWEQLHRVGKLGERLEIRLSADDVVQSVAAGTGP